MEQVCLHILVTCKQAFISYNNSLSALTDESQSYAILHFQISLYLEGLSTHYRSIQYLLNVVPSLVFSDV